MATFSPKHITEFKKWASAVGHSQQDLEIFTKLVEYAQRGEALDPKKVFKRLSAEAYSSARRRLHAKVITFLMKVEGEEDHTPISRIVGHLRLVLRCIRFRQSKAALYYLEQAEKMARAAKQLSLLDQILYLRVKHAEFFEIDAQSAIKAWELNSEHLHRFRQIEIAFTEIREQLQKAKKVGGSLNVEAIIHDVFRRFAITKQEANDPELILRLVGIGRAAYISVKQYAKIEHFVERFYRRFKKVNAFDNGLAGCELDYLYILAHTFYRNCKFKQASEYIECIAVHLDKHPSLHHAYGPRIASLKAGVMAHTGQNDKAIDELTKALKNRIVKEDAYEQANIQLNLAVYYFNDGDYKKAYKEIKKLPNAEQLLALKGREWMMKKDMIEAIVIYEMKEPHKALSCVKAILKTYADCWEQPLYTISYHFLLFAKRIFKDPNVLTDKKFRKELNEVRVSASSTQADIQVIAFYCWLKTRVIGKEYYQELVTRVSRK